MPYYPGKVLSRLTIKTPSPLLQPQALQLQGTEDSLPLQTPYNITELDAQVKALQQHRTRTAYNQNSPTDQTLGYIVKACQIAMHGSTLLSEENRRLRVENQRQKRKRDKRRSYIAQGGILAVGEGLQLAEERANNNKRSGLRLDMIKNTSVQRVCSQCKLAGHNIRTCPGII